MAEYDFHFTAEVMDGIFGEVITARGAWDTLGERLDNMEQGTGDTYTKAEVDTMLAEKVNTEEGKGLSSNDFTDSEKAQISANKAGIGAVAALSAKNLANFKFTGVVPNENIKPGSIIYTENNGVFSFSGTADDKNYAAYILKQFLLRAGTYRISGISGGSKTTYWMRTGTGTTDAVLFNLYDGEREFNLVSDTLITIQFVIYANQTVSNLIIKPMIRPASIEDNTFVPYAPTNRELFENKADKTETTVIVNNGAKNSLKNTAVSQSNMEVQFTVNNDGTVSVSGTASPAAAVFRTGNWTCPKSGTYVVSGCPQGGAWAPNPNKYRIRVAVNNTWRGDDTGKGISLSLVEGDVIEIQINTAIDYAVSNLVFKPMICTKAEWDISQEFVPYAPTNRELYEMILALQSGT